jgi:hypothetical protein
MPTRKNSYDIRKVMGRTRAINIEQFCPGEYIHFKDKTLYMLYKGNDLTFPDVAKIIRKKDFYNRPILECYQGSDTANNIQRFRDNNIGKEEVFVKLIEELSEKDMDNNKIEEIFGRYKKTLKPVCGLYKLCHYWPTLRIALDVRVYNGKPTVIHSSLVVRDTVAFIRRQITKEQLNNRWPEVLERVGIGTTITDVKYVSVPEHERELTSDVFVNKKDQIIPVRSYGKLVISKEPFEETK